MLTSNNSIISIIIPQIIYTKITYLFNDLVAENKPKGIYINQNNLNCNNDKFISLNRFQEFRLFVCETTKILLLLEKKIDKFFYQITITFNQQEILDFVEIVENNVNISGKQINQIKSILKSQEKEENSQQFFLFSLLKVLTGYVTIEEENSNNNQYHSLQKIVSNKIAQEKILHQITQHIQQDLDPLTILETIIKQTQSLLKTDRLLIYQIKIPVIAQQNKQTFVDTVTYEAKASKSISSVLNYSEDSCFSEGHKSLDKYKEEFCLVIEDIDEYKLDSCLKNTMKQLNVKAKIAIPIIVKNNIWGLLIAHQCKQTRKWKNEEINFLRNITEYLALAIYQYQSSQKLKDQKNLLEEQIENKAQQLKDALIVAQLAHQSKTEFLGNISHELRTPLTCVIGLSGTMLYWLKDIHQNDLSLEKRIRYLQMIQDSGRKLLELINNVLDFADLQAGKSLLNIQTFSLQNLAKIVKSSAQEIAQHQNINIILDYQVSSELELFNADEERVYQILLNLIDNAIKFTGEGGEVVIKFERNSTQTILKVEDTGIGINQEQIPLLFTQFKQLESYRNRIYPGTGLGLALTKHLVELHGGTIEVDSLIGKGSIFTVFLPDSPVQTNNKMSENTLIDEVVKINKTIVVVCDDDETGTLLCELLTAADYQVIWLLDEQEAITKIKLIQPMMVILEQPQKVLLRVTQKIKDRVANKVNIMVIKDYIDSSEWQKLSSVGVNDYMLKPIQPRSLLHKINETIDT